MSKDAPHPPHQIGLVNEKPLHAALKAWYARPGDRLEEAVDGFTVDVVRGDLLIEIQTRRVGAIRRKLHALAAAHQVRLVYPVARERWIVRLADDGLSVLARRRSPKRGAVEDVFQELVGLPALLANPNFSIEILMIQEEEVRRREAGRAWRRRGWVTQERRLVSVLESRVFRTPLDMGDLLPDGLPEPFTTAHLAEGLGRPRWLAQKMAYCLRKMGALHEAGRDGNAVLYVRAAA